MVHAITRGGEVGTHLHIFYACFDLLAKWAQNCLRQTVNTTVLNCSYKCVSVDFIYY